jgi:hypothetical protein
MQQLNKSVQEICQDQDCNRRIGTCPNQWREPPLVWFVEFMKKVHVEQRHWAECPIRPMEARRARTKSGIVRKATRAKCTAVK